MTTASPARHCSLPARSGLRTALYRLLCAASAVLVTIALVEAALRALFRGDVAQVLASRQRNVAPDASSILCVGDSYTFGLYYRVEEAYPARLEQLLCAGDPADGDGRARWFVENGGMPAQNLAQVAARLPEQLARLRPKAVVVLGGFNDRWNFAEPGDPGIASRLFSSLVVVKLARLVFASGGGEVRQESHVRIQENSAEQIRISGADGPTSVEIKKNGERLDDDTQVARVTARLEQIVAQVRAAGALPLLCSYPSQERTFEPPSRAAEAVAARLHVPFVDLRRAFALQLEQHRYDELLIPGDRHPTDRGYWRMAVLVAQALAEQQVWQPPPPLADALRAAPTADFAIPAIREQRFPIELAVLDANGTCKLSGPPDAHWKLLLSGSDAPVQDFGRIQLAMAADAIFARCDRDEHCEGELDARGETTLAIAPELRTGARWAALVVLHDQLLGAEDLQVRGIAGPIAVQW